MTDWYSVTDEDAQERLLGAWASAPITNLELCGMILDTAREDVVACAPAPLADALVVVDGIVTDTSVTPSRYVLAQLQQAKYLFDMHRLQEDPEGGADGLGYTPRPVDIKSIVRPRDGKPHVL